MVHHLRADTVMNPILLKFHELLSHNGRKRERNGRWQKIQDLPIRWSSSQILWQGVYLHCRFKKNSRHFETRRNCNFLLYRPLSTSSDPLDKKCSIQIGLKSRKIYTCFREQCSFQDSIYKSSDCILYATLRAFWVSF